MCSAVDRAVSVDPLKVTRAVARAVVPLRVLQVCTASRCGCWSRGTWSAEPLLIVLKREKYYLQQIVESYRGRCYLFHFSDEGTKDRQMK